MFSARTAWDRTENPLTLAIARVRAEGRQVVDLTESNPTRAALVDTSPSSPSWGTRAAYLTSPCLSATSTLAAR